PRFGRGRSEFVGRSKHYARIAALPQFRGMIFLAICSIFVSTLEFRNMHAHDDLEKLALDYHASPTPGKISVMPTKPLANQDDLSLAYSPGVAYACMHIHKDGDDAAAKYTSRSNLVGVITNGTAVLDMDNISQLTPKPIL